VCVCVCVCGMQVYGDVGVWTLLYGHLRLLCCR